MILRATGTGKTFKVDIPSYNGTLRDYHTICKELAEQAWKPNLHLMYSGGVDSEYILNLFLSLGMNIIPVIVRLDLDYNYHDISHATSFCESKGLRPVIIDIDFDDFVTSGKIIDVAESCQCGAYQLPATFHAVNQLDGPVIMGSHGPVHLSNVDEQWHIDELEVFHSVRKYFEVNKIEGNPFFLAQTAEQFHSFLQHPISRALVNNEYPGKLGNNSTKGSVYNDISGFEMRHRNKYTGYEVVDRSEIVQHENIQWFKDRWDGRYLELVKR
jgi:hypothetical protein